MSKYIDAEKLKAKVKELNLATKTYEEQVAFNNALAMVVEIIDSLQQEQPDIECSPVMKELIDKLFGVGNAFNFGFGPKDFQQEQPEPVKGKFVFPKLLYARTLDNKTIDVSYGPQDMTAIEYVRNDFVEQEQPEVDLEKEIETCLKQHQMLAVGKKDFTDIARHFYELGLNARKEK